MKIEVQKPCEIAGELLNEGLHEVDNNWWVQTLLARGLIKQITDSKAIDSETQIKENKRK